MVMYDLRDALKEQAFTELFIELLGWNRFSAVHELSVEGDAFRLEGVAEKCGVGVYICTMDRISLANRELLRRIQKMLRLRHHEHILIARCSAPSKQVWQWVARAISERRIVHREHPFFSADPPPLFLLRLQNLEVTLEEEEGISLAAIRQRLRKVLSPGSEFNLFTRFPRYAQQTEHLLNEYRNGNRDSFSEFAALHTPLVRKAARRLQRWFRMDVDDAMQTAMIGLIQAAHRWQPERGYQFSTYAYYWLWHACEQYGPRWGAWFHVPRNWIVPCARAERLWRGSRKESNSHQGRVCLGSILKRTGLTTSQWRAYRASRRMRFLEELNEEVSRSVEFILSTEADNSTETLGLRDEVDHLLGLLPSRHAEIMRLRFGIDSRPHSLEELGKVFGVTRERIRQLESDAIQRIRKELGTWQHHADTSYCSAHEQNYKEEL
jgi:RNA polymerase sigma factor (sigma-70 family)